MLGIEELTRWWKRRRRSVDMRILVGAFREQSPHRDAAAKLANAHMASDSAWSDASKKERREFVKACCHGMPTRVGAAITKARGGKAPDQLQGFS